MKSISTTIRSRHVLSIEALTGQLRRPMGDPPICVLAPMNRRELSTLIDHRHLMRDLRIILILPDEDDRMARDGHLLRPRFISQGRNRFSNTSAVVGRMVHRCRADYIRTTQGARIRSG